MAESERFNHFCLNWVKSYIVAFEFVILSILKQQNHKQKDHEHVVNCFRICIFEYSKTAHLSQSTDLSVVTHCFRNKKPHLSMRFFCFID